MRRAPTSQQMRAAYTALTNPPRSADVSAILARELATEDSCWRFLREVRWPSGHVRNPHTGVRAVRFKPGRRLWVDATGAEFSLFAGSALERTKVPLRTWLLLAFSLAATPTGISAAQAARQYGMRLATAYLVLARLRTGLVDPDRTPLRGRLLLSTVAVPVAGSTPVILAVELLALPGQQIRLGRLRLRAVDVITTQTIQAFATDHLDPGAVVSAGDSRTLAACTAVGLAGHLAPASERVHADRLGQRLVGWLGTTHGGAVSPQHLQSYLNEFAFRASYRFEPMTAFRAALGIELRVPAPTRRAWHRAEPGRWQHVNPPSEGSGSQAERAGTPTGGHRRQCRGVGCRRYRTVARR